MITPQELESKLKTLAAASDTATVKNPAHYEGTNGVECIQAIKNCMSAEAYCGYLRGNAIKYLWRFDRKGKPLEDLQKAAEYIRLLIEEERKKGAENGRLEKNL